MELNGFLISWATPAARPPIAASFSCRRISSCRRRTSPRSLNINTWPTNCPSSLMIFDALTLTGTILPSTNSHNISFSDMDSPRSRASFNPQKWFGKMFSGSFPRAFDRSKPVMRSAALLKNAIFPFLSVAINPTGKLVTTSSANALVSCKDRLAVRKLCIQNIEMNPAKPKTTKTPEIIIVFRISSFRASSKGLGSKPTSMIFSSSALSDGKHQSLFEPIIMPRLPIIWRIRLFIQVSRLETGLKSL